MKTKRRALTSLSSITWSLVLAAPLLGCSSSSSPAATTDAATPPGDAGDAGTGVDAANDSAPSSEAGADAGVDPSLNPDPQDLDPTNGDPSLDIAGSQIYFDNGQPWVRVAFYGPWPPAATVYSWACAVLLGTANAPVVTYTVQGTNGVQTTDAQGMAIAQITLATEPKGFRVLFANTTLVFDRYALECNVQVKDTGGKMLQDDSGPFVITTKMQKTFGP